MVFSKQSKMSLTRFIKPTKSLFYSYIRPIGNDLISPIRNLSTTAILGVKEIQVRTSGNITTVEGIVVESDRKGKVLDLVEGQEYCPLCPLKLNTTVKYTDVLILSQFLRPDGRLLPRTVTGLCTKAHERMQRLVHQSQRAGLMPELRPELAKGAERKRLKSGYKWRKYNIYYDE